MNLSPREREIADCLCAGMTLTATAAKLAISKHTARNHLKHVFAKLGVHSQNELTARIRHVAELRNNPVSWIDLPPYIDKSGG